MPDPCLADSSTIALDLTDDQALVAAVTISPDAYNGLEDRSATSGGLWSPGRAPIVSALPTSPVDGDEICILPDPSDTTIRWWLTYDAISGKWVWKCGAEMHADGPGDSTRGSNGDTWGDCADGPGPSLTMPSIASGVYRVTWGFRGRGTGTGETYMGIKFSAAEATTGLAAQNNGDMIASVIGKATLTIAAGQQVKARYRISDVGGTAVFQRRWLEIRPVYLG